MEYDRALADLEEVRDRLAACQQFTGYSGPAAIASGIIAVVAGLIQATIVSNPASEAGSRAYLAVWFTCLAIALVLNYGAIAIWYSRTRAHQDRSGARSAGLTLLPAILLGAVLSVAMILHQAVSLLPGVWYACYAVGLFASRSMVPKGTTPVAALFAAGGLLLLLWPDQRAPLEWWVMPLGFGLGQAYIGALLLQESRVGSAS
jgi:hypothetical protein